MTAGLHALLNGVVDYAGLFPPAELSLDDAVAEFLAVRKSAESWMLGRFVIPASRLAELSAFAEEFAVSDPPLPLAIIGQAGADFDGWQANLETTLAHVERFTAGFGTALGDAVLELPVSGQAHDNPGREDTVSRELDAIASKIPASGHPIVTVFLEVGPAADVGTVRDVLIRRCGEQRGTTAASIGFKLRTGGLKPEAFPDVEELVSVVDACRRHKCLWKATAGLHHPVRHTDQKLGVKMHGFLNVLFAAVLADAHELAPSAIHEILADEDAGHFEITDDGIRWRDFTANVAQIDAARAAGFQSFGSCSFAEPREDLRALGLL